MVEYEEKFIVINTKRFDELFNKLGNTTDNPVFSLTKAIQTFQLKYEEVMNKKISQKYYVCNQDEPYAQEVINIILAGEQKKEKGE